MNKKFKLLLLMVGLLTIGLYSIPLILRPTIVRNVVGVNGPIVVDLKRRVDEDAFKDHLVFSPTIEGTWHYYGTLASFMPKSTFKENSTYTLSLSPGGNSSLGLQLLFPQKWNIHIRPPEILVIRQPNDDPEIWSYARDGSSSRQFTFTNGQVIDFAASQDGEKVAYSAYNSQGGSDIFWQDRSQTTNSRLTSCGEDTCTQPAWSADGEWLAFTRTRKGVSRIWIGNISEDRASQLSDKYEGQYPNWSPSGDYLAFFNPVQNEIDVIDTETLAWQVVSTTIPQKPVWKQQGTQFLVLRNFVGEGQPYTKVIQVNLDTKALDFVLGEDFNSADYGMPAWHPDGEWVAVSRRAITNMITKQIVVMRLDGSEEFAMTNTPMYTHAAISWDLAGEYLLYQRYAVGVGGAKPEVEVRSFPGGALVFHLEDAALPQWLP